MAHVRTFKDLQDQVLRQLDEAGDEDTTLALVKDALNDANRKRVTQTRWPFMLWDTPQTLSIVADQQLYALHSEYFWPFYFYNRTKNTFMSQVDESGLVESGADWINDTGAAARFTLWGRTEVAAQPSTPSVIAVASSNATDNGAQSVILRGDTADGVVSEEVTCGSNSSNTFIKLLKVTKKGTWLGTMTLTAGSDTLLKLFNNEAGRSYQQIFLLASPDEAEVVEYRFYRQPFFMSEDEDRPDVPTPFEDIIVYDALLNFAAYNRYDNSVVKIWEKKRDELLQAMQAAYADARAIEAQVNYTHYIPR